MVDSIETGLNPFVFIVGCLRSGTTLLRRIVDAHPELAIIHETQWLPRWFERRIGVTPDGYATPELVDRLLAYPRFAELGIDRAQLDEILEDREPVPYSRFVSSVFDLYGNAEGKRLVGEKCPSYVRYLPTMHALWPRAKIVHIVRDGRDVCLSVINWKKADHNPGRFSTWSEDPVTTAALWWEWHVRQGLAESRSLGAALHYQLRYESLIAKPEAECEALCDFLRLPFDVAMLNFHQGGRRPNRPLDPRMRKWRPLTSGRRNWRTDLPIGELERFEAAVGELLEQLGYERAVSRLTPAAREHAARIREVFEREAALGP